MRLDRFVHMLHFYDLVDHAKRGTESVASPTLMAKRTKLTPPGVSRPFARDMLLDYAREGRGGIYDLAAPDCVSLVAVGLGR